MESLLCNEVWLMSPTVHPLLDNVGDSDKLFYHDVRRSDYAKEDCENAIGVFLEKEASYIPKPGFFNYVQSDNLIHHARFKAIYWFLKTQKQMDLSFGTVFGAVSYMDRFISITQCKGWKYWMFELLSIACLSVATKFNESFTVSSLHEFQAEGLNHSFSSCQIQRMELTLLKALGWRMDSPTPYSYMELLIYTINTLNTTLFDNLMTLVAQLLVNTLLDSKFLRYRPCVIAMSAIRCIVEDHDLLPCNTSLDHFDTFISEDQREEAIKCKRWMEKELMRDYSSMVESNYTANYQTAPESPVTVLKVELDKFYEYQLDLYLFNKPNIKINFRPSNKRKREEDNVISKH